MPELPLLGSSIRFARGLVSASISDARKADYAATLKNVLRRNTPSPAALAEFRAKLGFAQSLMFG